MSQSEAPAARPARCHGCLAVLGCPQQPSTKSCPEAKIPLRPEELVGCPAQVGRRGFQQQERTMGWLGVAGSVLAGPGSGEAQN